MLAKLSVNLQWRIINCLLVLHPTIQNEPFDYLTKHQSLSEKNVNIQNSMSASYLFLVLNNILIVYIL